MGILVLWVEETASTESSPSFAIETLLFRKLM